MKKLRLAISSALIILTTLVIPANTFTAAATTPPNLWARTYGGAQTEDARSAKQTSDGGFIVAGTTNSFGAGGFDMWVVRLDSLGHVVWQRTYGGTGNDFALSVDQTSDGGFIVAGNTASFGAGSYDAWVLRLDAMGLVVWQKTYGGAGTDEANSVQQTSDGGYIVSGSYSRATGADVWVLKLDAMGLVIWQKTYGGTTADDFAEWAQPTSDGGFIVVANTFSLGAGGADVWVLKLDSVGGLVWQNTYGGTADDSANSVQQTSDSGFIVAGNTRSFGAGSADVWVLKLDSVGGVVWQKTYGGISDDFAESVRQTSDGGFIVAGNTNSFGAGGADVWVLKLDAMGLVIWQKTYGGIADDYALSVRPTSNGDGFIVAGITSSFGVGGQDAQVLRLDARGNINDNCNLTRTSSASVADSTGTVTTTAITGVDTSVTGTTAGPTIVDTRAKTHVQCVGK